MFFGWKNIRNFIREIILTLTQRESRFSQKKLLIYVIDITMLSTSIIYMYQHRTTMTTSDHCMIVGMWLAKGLSNVIMSQGDKKIENDDTNDNTNNDDNININDFPNK